MEKIGTLLLRHLCDVGLPPSNAVHTACMNILSEVYVCAIVVHWPVRTCAFFCAYMCAFFARTVLSPPHKGLCGAQACNFATSASCNRVMWSTSYFTIRYLSHTAKLPHLTSDKVGKFYDTICWGCTTQTWSQKTVKMDQMWCHVRAGLLHFWCKNSNGHVIFCLCP